VTDDQEVTWDFPIKPGMVKWQQFKSVKEMYQECQIPDKILKQLDTESLVNICLSFPSPPIFPLFNTPQQGFMEYYTNFNGIQELFRRKDAGQYLLKKYSMMSLLEFDPSWPLHEQGRFISNYKFIEAILSQSQIVASLDTNGRKMLLREAISKMDEKISKSDLFSGFSIEINLWVIGKLLQSEEKLSSEDYNKEQIQTALETGMFVDIDVDMLFQQAKKYAHENE
jgi:hypothetical protein